MIWMIKQRMKRRKEALTRLQIKTIETRKTTKTGKKMMTNTAMRTRTTRRARARLVELKTVGQETGARRKKPLLASCGSNR
jgi:hypothetical protein